MQEVNVLLSAKRFGFAADLFEQLKDISYAVIKGEPLSVLAYGECGKRHLGDIDLLVDRKNLDEVERLLLGNGFKSTLKSRADRIMMLTTAHQIAPYVKEMPPYKNVMIDVNFDIFWGEYEGKRIPVYEFLEDTIELDIYGYKIKSLTPLKAFVQLVLHQYKDMNSLYILFERGGYNLKGLGDIFHLWRRNIRDISLKKLWEISERYSIIPYVYYIMYHVGLLYEDKVLKSYVEALKTEEGLRLINCYGLSEFERREWKVDLRTRLRDRNLNTLLQNEFTENDKKKIELNRKVF